MYSLFKDPLSPKTSVVLVRDVSIVISEHPHNNGLGAWGHTTLLFVEICWI